ncbi:hypothetical protein RE474_00330 [Methanolobus sediminis]|uniref:Uncharacterized protein n=1 Tax=Methanolobus sediminis TaxID=3072978 RepID=A0AA51YLP7_9EURY|nr:hypothetical protein [Methanolobus sediminis]WMW25199.1 hypothetical protein RE474_00330 [Methanolobus sediminis]
MQIKKTNVRSFAKKAAIIFAVLFELLVIIFMIPSSPAGIENDELLLIAGVILLAPFIYGTIGFAAGTFIATIFNIIVEIIDI